MVLHTRASEQRHREHLRVLGAKIDYSRSDYTFYYTNSFELHLNLQVEYLDENDKKMYFCRQFFI